MKKFLALLLALVMVVGLVACGSKDAVQKPAQTFTEISEEDADLPF